MILKQDETSSSLASICAEVSSDGLLRSNTRYEGYISRALVIECGKYLCKSGSGLRISFKAAYY